MSTIYGVTFSDKLCRGCLVTEEADEFFKLENNMRFFTNYLNINMNSLEKNFLCTNCQNLISLILNYGDRVLKANSVLLEITKRNNFGDKSKVDLISNHESRNTLGFESLSNEIKISVESLALVGEDYSQMKADTRFNRTNSPEDFPCVNKDEELSKDLGVDCAELNRKDTPGGGITVKIDFNNTETSDHDETSSLDDGALKSMTTASETRNNVNAKSLRVTTARNNVTKTTKDSNISANITIINLSKKEVSEEFARLANDTNKTTLFYKCNLCYKGLSSRELYNEHMELHSEKSGDYECEICHKRFRTDRRLFAHAYQHTKRYRCNACGLQCRSRDSVVGHIKTVHDHVGDVTCDECKSTFKNSYALQRHIIYTHRNRARVECEQCHSTFGSKSTLRNHRKLKHADNLPENEHRFVCTTCGKAFFKMHNLKNHMAKHTETRDFYCVECDLSFKTEKCLNQHLKDTLKHADPDKIITCQMCPRIFADKKYLTRHIADSHRAEFHKCEHCSKEYSSKKVLRKHTRFAHEGHKEARRFVCDVCGATFTRKITLLNHMNIHLGMRPYICTICSADFTHSGSLYTHKKLKHKLGTKRT